jgi:hypothetical protein
MGISVSMLNPHTVVKECIKRRISLWREFAAVIYKMAKRRRGSFLGVKRSESKPTEG